MIGFLRGGERKERKLKTAHVEPVSCLFWSTWTTSLSMHHRVMHMHFSLLQQLHDHFPLVAAARSIYGELLFLLIVSTVDFSFHFLFSTFRYVIFISCTNNNIREWDEDKREFEFRIDLFYFSLWNSLNEMKLSLLNNYDQENNNFSRWYISIFFSFSVGNLVFVFSLPFLFFSKYFSRNEIARNRLKLRVTRIRDAIRERKSIHLVKISLLRLVFTFRNR